MKALAAAAAALMIVTPAAAPAMTVAEFLGKVDALKARGIAALWSPDIKLLKAEGLAAGRQLRVEQEAAVAARRRPATCMPQPAKLGQSEFLAYLNAIPPAQRSMTVKDAMAGAMRRKYPCPA